MFFQRPSALWKSFQTRARVGAGMIYRLTLALSLWERGHEKRTLLSRIQYSNPRYKLQRLCCEIHYQYHQRDHRHGITDADNKLIAESHIR